MVSPAMCSQPSASAGFDLVFERHPSPMLVVEDATLRVLAANEAAVRKYGYSLQELLACSLQRLDLVGQAAPVSAVIATARRGGAQSGTTGPCRQRCRNGTPIEVQCTWTTVPFAGRSCVTVVVEDVTATKRLAESFKDQARLLDLASDAIILCDLWGSITYWNQGAERLYGWTTSEVLGSPVMSILMSDSASSGETERAVRARGEWTGRFAHVRKDGKKVYVNSRWTLVKDDRGTPRSILVINSDITEAKNLENQFLRAQRLESIGRLASGIAHDLNNILSPILMSATLLRRSATAPEATRMIDLIEASAERGAGIVKQVLTFARGVEGDRVMLQPKHLVCEMAKILSQTFPRNIDVRTQFPSDLWTIIGDATQIDQILLNLCVNARDAMSPGGGTLTVAAENVEVDEHFARTNTDAQLGRHVVLRVADTGGGIPPETMEKMFEPFYTTKEVGKGTGLGLSTVQSIVKGHSGFLTVQSRVGSGTTFSIFIPAIHAEMPAEVAKEQEDLRGNGETILLVEDEVAIRDSCVSALKSNGYGVYTAEDGSDALSVFFQRRREVKLIITDLAMGKIDGIEFVRAVRKLDAKIKIIVSTGHCQPEQAEQLESLGVKTILAKPYSASRLMQAVHGALNGTKRPTVVEKSSASEAIKMLNPDEH